MNNDNETLKDFPQNLDLNEWLKFSLTSYNEITRQIALVEITGNGFTSDFLEILSNIAKNDPSQSCRSQANWVIKVNENKKEVKSRLKSFDVTPEFISSLIQSEDFAKINVIKQLLRKSPPEQIVDLWRGVLNKEKNPTLIEFALDILTKFGEKDDSVYAIKHLQNNNSQVICAALSFLASKDSDLLKKHIRQGLSSKTANILIHSVHLLKTIDEPETIKYLSLLILNQNPLVRQKALRELMLIKFENVEDLFWQYLGREDQPFLLVKAGLLATFNPAKHFPFKIYDIMSIATGTKKHILQLILKQTLATTNLSGIINNSDFNAYVNKLKKYIANKKIEQTIRVTVANLKAEEVDIRADAIEKLSRFISHPQIKSLLINQLKVEKDPEIKSYLVSLFEDSPDEDRANILGSTSSVLINKKPNSDSLIQNKVESKSNTNEAFPILPNLSTLGSMENMPSLPTFNESKNEKSEVDNSHQQIDSSAIVEKKESSLRVSDVNEATSVADSKIEEKQEKTAILTSFPNTEEFLNLSSKEQRALLKKITNIESYPVTKNTLIEVLDKKIKKTVALDIIKIIGEYGNNDDAKKIYHLTKSDDESIAAQTIKSIGRIDIDKILPELNIFLANKDPRIKSSAFEIYAIVDKTAAVQYVGTMLKNTKDSIRRIGLSLIPQLDYSSAEPLLWWMLDHESNIELQDQVGYMIAANPTKDGIIKIFEYTHDNNGELKEGFSEMWNIAVISAENVFGISKEEIEKNCWDSRVSLKNEETKESYDYKFKSVVGEKDEIETEMERNAVSTIENNLLEKILIHIYEYKKQYIITVSVILLLFVIKLLTQKDENTLYRANKDIVVSEVNYIPSEGSDKVTQVGGDDWKEGIKSGARNIIRSPQYAALMQSAAEEREAFREEAKEKEKEYFQKLANDSTADKEDREWAEAKLNENYDLGTQLFEAENYAEAEAYLEKAANDPKLNTFGKVDAIQKLMEICDKRNDKAKWSKWMSRLLKETKHNVEGFSQVEAFEDFDKTLSTIENFTAQLKTDPRIKEEYLKGMKEKYKYTEEEAQQALDDLINFKHPFDERNK